MPEVVFAIPVLPGMEELDRQTFDEMAGSRREEYVAALKEAGIRRQAVWHEQTPDGTLAIVYIEGEAPDAAARFTASEAPISRFFVEQMREVHGVDISEQPPPPVEKVHDVQV